MSVRGLLLTRKVRAAIQQQGQPATVHLTHYPGAQALEELDRALDGKQMVFVELRGDDGSSWLLSVADDLQTSFKGVCTFYRMMFEREPNDVLLAQELRAAARQLRDEIAEDRGVAVTDPLIE